MTVNVSGTAGPFVITSQTYNLSLGKVIQLIGLIINTILPGSANVNIRLSVDGELLFPCY
jgi:hypothetical protein